MALKATAKLRGEWEEASLRSDIARIAMQTNRGSDKNKSQNGMEPQCSKINFLLSVKLYFSGFFSILHSVYSLVKSIYDQ